MAVNRREKSIEEALESAELARKELKKLQNSNSALLQEARDEREQLLKEAKAMKNEIIAEAKTKAQEEAEKVLIAAREEIKIEKSKAIAALKTQVADFSFQIAEKLLTEKLSDKDKQSATVTTALNEINFN